MKRPEEADYAVLKAAAEKASGSAEVEDLEFEQLFCVVRKPTSKEFHDYLDAAFAKNSDAALVLALRCTLWPSRSELNSVLGAFPFLAHRIVETFEEQLGGNEPRAVHALDEQTPADLIAELNIPAEAAADVRARYPHKGQLKLFQHELATVILHAPSQGTATLWKKQWESKDKARALRDLAMSCTAWPNEESARALYDRLPGLPYAMMHTMLDLGGASDKARRKKR